MKHVNKKIEKQGQKQNQESGAQQSFKAQRWPRSLKWCRWIDGLKQMTCAKVCMNPNLGIKYKHIFFLIVGI
ncbi:hypothetical protein LguiA_025522 [Lonicera macranthoides]